MEQLHRETSMMEDCATGMSASHGCNDDTAVVESFKEALIGRVGSDVDDMSEQMAGSILRSQLPDEVAETGEDHGRQLIGDGIER